MTVRSLLPADVHPYATAAAAWQAVRVGEADAAWLAAGNSTVGEITATRTARHEGVCLLAASFAIRHALLAPAGTRLSDLAAVHGHPAAVGQCAGTLRRLAARARMVEAVDGAHAAAGLAPREAVLGPPGLAALHGLAVLAADVSDRPDNRTTFHLLAQVGPDRAG